jgi:hypothetical protein
MEDNLTQQEISVLEACKSEEEWDAACLAVKTARAGHYPSDWWNTMKRSGRMDRIVASFAGSTEIKITSYR